MPTAPKKVTDLPENVTLDLDAYERPAEEVIPPFVVRLGGRTVTMTNPEDIDWQDLLDIENPADFLRYCVDKDDAKFILGLALPGHKFAKLMETYQEHYGIEEKLDAARRRNRRGF